MKFYFNFIRLAAKKTKLKLKSVSIVRYANRNCQQLCLFVRIEKKKMTTMVSIQWHIKLPHVFKENEETEKKDLLCSVFIDFVLFLHSTNWICTIHIHIRNVPKTAPLFFFSFFAKIKANILLATFNPTKQGIIECWQPIKKKTILYASFVVQVPFIYEHTWVFLFNLYTIKSDILKSATEISTGKVFNKTFAWCVSALPNV